MQKREINAKSAPQPSSAFSQAVEVTGGTRTLFISGQLGTNADGTTPATMSEQAQIAWRNLGAQLAAAGMSFKNLVKVTMIIPDATETCASRAQRAAVLGDHRPASTIIVAGLVNPAYKIEIEGIACA